MLIYSATRNDITILLHGNANNIGQGLLNKLASTLKRKQLTINPAKSEQLDIGGSGPQLAIGGANIRKVDYINVLGVTINGKLKLCSGRENNARMLGKISDSVRRLTLLREHNLLRSKKQWRMLMNASIKSIIIDNNLPMLAIDKSARKWADLQLCRAIKIANGSSANVSNKLVKALYAIGSIDNMVEMQLVNGRFSSVFKGEYELLHRWLTTGKRSATEWLRVTGQFEES